MGFGEILKKRLRALSERRLPFWGIQVLETAMFQEIAIAEIRRVFG